MTIPHVAPLQPDPDTLQVTAVFAVPVTDASNCCVPPAGSVSSGGVTLTTTTGTIVTFAEADLVGSATLVAITLTPTGEEATEGAE